MNDDLWKEDAVPTMAQAWRMYDHPASLEVWASNAHPHYPTVPASLEAFIKATWPWLEKKRWHRYNFDGDTIALVRDTHAWLIAFHPRLPTEATRLFMLPPFTMHLTTKDLEEQFAEEDFEDEPMVMRTQELPHFDPDAYGQGPHNLDELRHLWRLFNLNTLAVCGFSCRNVAGLPDGPGFGKYVRITYRTNAGEVQTAELLYDDKRDQVHARCSDWFWNATGNVEPER